MKKVKNDNLINLQHIMDEAKKYDKVELASLSGGFDLQFYPEFSQTKVQKVILNIAEFLSYHDEEDKESMEFVKLITDEDEHENLILIIYFFIVAEFTSIGEQIKEEVGKDKTPKNLFPYFDALIKTGYLHEIVNDVFMPEQVEKVMEVFAEQSALSHHLSVLSTQFAEEMEKNKDKIERIYASLPKKENDVDEEE